MFRTYFPESPSRLYWKHLQDMFASPLMLMYNKIRNCNGNLFRRFSDVLRRSFLQSSPFKDICLSPQQRLQRIPVQCVLGYWTKWALFISGLPGPSDKNRIEQGASCSIGISFKTCKVVNPLKGPCSEPFRDIWYFAQKYFRVPYPEICQDKVLMGNSFRTFCLDLCRILAPFQNLWKQLQDFLHLLRISSESFQEIIASPQHILIKFPACLQSLFSNMLRTSISESPVEAIWKHVQDIFFEPLANYIGNICRICSHLLTRDVQ